MISRGRKSRNQLILDNIKWIYRKFVAYVLTDLKILSISIFLDLKTRNKLLFRFSTQTCQICIFSQI